MVGECGEYKMVGQHQKRDVVKGSSGSGASDLTASLGALSDNSSPPIPVLRRQTPVTGHGTIPA